MMLKDRDWAQFCTISYCNFKQTLNYLFTHLLWVYTWSSHIEITRWYYEVITKERLLLVRFPLNKNLIHHIPQNWTISNIYYIQRCVRGFEAIFVFECNQFFQGCSSHLILWARRFNIYLQSVATKQRRNSEKRESEM